MADGQTDRQIYVQTAYYTNGQTDRQMTDGQTDICTDWQTDIWTDEQTNKLTNCQTVDRQINKWTNKQKDIASFYFVL